MAWTKHGNGWYFSRILIAMPRTPAPPAQPASQAPPKPRRIRRRLPVFALYGEGQGAVLRLLHIESIISRSRLYDWEIDAHVHHGLHQVLWVWQGSVHALLDETRIQSDGPLALVVPPGVAHAFRFAPHTEGYVLTFDASLLAEQDGSTIGTALHTLFATPAALPLPVQEAATAHLHQLWQTLHAEAHHPTTAHPAPVPLWLACSVLWHLAQWRARFDGPPRQQGRHALYTRWLVLVEQHYSQHWPIPRYADQLGLSAERLNRLVRAETGHSAQHIVHTRLVREACRLLVHVQAPVSQLAFDLGFSDPAYFSRFFKRHTGQTPAAYRQAAVAA